MFYAPPDADLTQLPKLQTQERALAVFKECGYNVEEALAAMKSLGPWSAKKRVFGTAFEELDRSLLIHSEPWDEEDIKAFEAGMRLQPKRFRYVLHEHLGGRNKTLLQVMQFYYVWKKLPRYALWKKRRTFIPGIDCVCLICFRCEELQPRAKWTHPL